MILSAAIAIAMSVMPIRYHHPPMRMVKHELKLPSRLNLGDTPGIVFFKLGGLAKCKHITVEPKEFWIIDCDDSRLRLLGTWSYGLVQYEEYGADASSIVDYVCDVFLEKQKCIEGGSVVLTTPTWYIDDTTGEIKGKDIVIEYNSKTGRLLYQEWMQWSLEIDFLKLWKEHQFKNTKR